MASQHNAFNPYESTRECAILPVTNRNSYDLLVIPAGVSAFCAIMFLAFVPITFYEFVFVHVIKNDLKRSVGNVALASIIPVYVLYLGVLSTAALIHWTNRQWKSGLAFNMFSFFGIYSTIIMFEYIQYFIGR